jgi:hypothetical protein
LEDTLNTSSLLKRVRTTAGERSIPVRIVGPNGLIGDSNWFHFCQSEEGYFLTLGHRQNVISDIFAYLLGENPKIVYYCFGYNTPTFVWPSQSYLSTRLENDPNIRVAEVKPVKGRGLEIDCKEVLFFGKTFPLKRGTGARTLLSEILESETNVQKIFLNSELAARLLAEGFFLPMDFRGTKFLERTPEMGTTPTICLKRLFRGAKVLVVDQLEPLFVLGKPKQQLEIFE